MGEGNRFVRKIDLPFFFRKMSIFRRQHRGRTTPQKTAVRHNTKYTKTHKHDLKSIVEGNLALVGTDSHGFSSHTKTLTSLRVTNNGPDDAEGLELVGTGFSRIGAVSSVDSTVLGSNRNVLSEGAQELGNVNVRNTQSDLNVVGNRSGIIEYLDAIGVFVPGSIALPVSADQVLAGSFSANVRGGSFGAGRLECTVDKLKEERNRRICRKSIIGRNKMKGGC